MPQYSRSERVDRRCKANGRQFRPRSITSLDRFSKLTVETFDILSGFSGQVDRLITGCCKGAISPVAAIRQQHGAMESSGGTHGDR